MVDKYVTCTGMATKNVGRVTNNSFGATKKVEILLRKKVSFLMHSWTLVVTPEQHPGNTFRKRKKNYANAFGTKRSEEKKGPSPMPAPNQVLQGLLWGLWKQQPRFHA